MTALCDSIAAMLSERTGSVFTVLRGRQPVSGQQSWRSRRGWVPKTVLRYSLRVERNGHAHHFYMGSQALSGVKMTYALAALSDMVNMGFVPVLPPTKEPVT